MMTNKDNVKLQNERHQLIIQELLRDDDNKYCVDCDAKGPRWASWNLGVFLCIRCAGIHRNLGVHISKVKSVNLDTWTPAQLAVMRDMGNSRARAIYEARLPDNFRRPQTDSALESFIRAKYEQKRYIAPEYVPTKPDVDGLMKELQRLEQAQKKRPTSSVVNLTNTIQAPNTVPRPNKGSLLAEKETPDPSQNTAVDLLGLDAPCTTPTDVANKTEDIFGQFTSSTLPNNPDFFEKQTGSFPNQSHVENHDLLSQPTQSNSSLSSDLFGLEFPGSNFPSASGVGVNAFPNPTKTSETGTKATKDSILALYQQIPTQPCVATSGSLGSIPTNFNQVNPPPYSAGQFFAGIPSSMNTSNFNGMTTPSGTYNQFLPPNTTAAPMGNMTSFNNNGFQPNLTNQTSWSDPKSWSAFKTDQPNPNQSAVNFGAFQGTSGFGSNPPVHNCSPMQQWNCNPSSANTTFGDKFSNTPSTKTPNPQAYLSQVQNQLASLQIGTTNQFQ